MTTPDTATGNATVQHGVLAALTAAERCVPIEDLAAAAGLSRRQTANGAAALIARGYVVRRERGCYEVTAAGAAAHAAGTPLTSGPTGPMERKQPVANALRSRLWKAMRMRSKFALADLLVLAATGDERDPSANAGRYLRALVASGYLSELRRTKGGRQGSNGAKRYVLLRDSGPKPPIVRRGGVEVYDPNTGVVHPCAVGNRDAG